MSMSPSVGFTPHNRGTASSAVASAPSFQGKVHQSQVQEFNAIPLTVVTDGRIVAEQARARALGYSAGYAAGARAAAAELAAQVSELESQEAAREAAQRTELAQMFTALSGAISAAQAIQVPLLASARDMVCTLAFDLARGIVGVELPQASTDVPGVTVSTLAAVTRAVRAAPQTSMLTIKMAPQEAAQALEHWDQVLAYLDTQGTLPADSVQVVADPSLEPGGAQAHYPNGYVDATLINAFDRAQQALSDMLAHPVGASAP